MRWRDDGGAASHVEELELTTKSKALEGGSELVVEMELPLEIRAVHGEWSSRWRFEPFMENGACAREKSSREIGARVRDWSSRQRMSSPRRWSWRWRTEIQWEIRQ
ncbi:hypothetical protein TIFTF001_027503 [Ficus carica]|uniref:Uncharacterized protein n=1 Tax=Ficus carica TaxID=3494 RepID=A0AA88DNI2_FICCA|nr:hypothetical protein TIFTF001_027503 [Ficus carica]